MLLNSVLSLADICFKHLAVELIAVIEKCVRFLRHKCRLFKLLHIEPTVPAAYLTVNGIVQNTEKFDISFKIHILLFLVRKIEVYIIKGISL